MPSPRPRLVVQLVGTADYMGTSLEENDNHTMHMYNIFIQQI